MGKLFTPQDISSGFQTTDSLNNNFAAIETALDACLSRTGEVPNSMSADIDMNGNDILNLNSLSVDTLLVDGGEVPSLSQVQQLLEDALAAQSAAEAAQAAAEAASIAAKQTGQVVPFAMNSAPLGWLECNGAAVSRATYADLFSLIGTTYGVGDGSTTFNVPQMIDRFVGGAGNDWTVGESFSDAVGAHTHTGTTVADGGHTPTGSTSTDGSHTHSIQMASDTAGTNLYPANIDNVLNSSHTTQAAGDHSHTVTMDPVADHTHSFTTDSTGAAHTVPQGVAMLWCIKY